MNDISEAVRQLLGTGARRIAPVTSGNNELFRIETAAGQQFVLKRYDESRSLAFRREVGMRNCLRRFSRVRFPKIIQQTALGGHRYLLMEDAAGQSLDEIWSGDKSRAEAEINALGRLLARIHTIPVNVASEFLEREEQLYSPDYFAWMKEQIGRFLSLTAFHSRLQHCYEVIKKTPVRQAIIHGDFGPHQVVVDEDGEWLLVDFEYAAIGAFADDLAGTEVRLVQKGYGDIADFLAGYAAIHPVLPEYEPVRNAYGAYALLSILTYRLAHKGEEPLPGDLERMERLLEAL